MPEFSLVVTKTTYQTTIVTVEAADLEHANCLADDLMAGPLSDPSVVWSEGGASYEVEDVDTVENLGRGPNPAPTEAVWEVSVSNPNQSFILGYAKRVDWNAKTRILTLTSTTGDVLIRTLPPGHEYLAREVQLSRLVNHAYHVFGT